jgi:hypothetical protein
MSDENKLYTSVGVWLALGAGIGTAIGAATQNTGVWLALGAGIGVAIGAALSAIKGRKDED